jgi:hypothetical protein
LPPIFYAASAFFVKGSLLSFGASAEVEEACKGTYLDLEDLGSILLTVLRRRSFLLPWLLLNGFTSASFNYILMPFNQLLLFWHLHNIIMILSFIYELIDISKPLSLLLVFRQLGKSLLSFRNFWLGHDNVHFGSSLSFFLFPPISYFTLSLTNFISS